MAKKLLLISVSNGSGHVRAADALQRTAELSFPNFTVDHIDMTDYLSRAMKTAIHSYDLMVREMPELWGYLYKKTDNAKTSRRYQRMSKLINGLNASKFYAHVTGFAPNYILCTHFLPVQTLLEAPKKYDEAVQPSILMTDYGKHMLLIHPGVREYFVATEKMGWELTRYNVAKKKIIVSGIPIQPAFFEAKSPGELRKKYRLPPDKPIILVLSGGQGLINTAEIVAALFNLAAPLAIIAVAGKNEQLRKKIAGLAPPSHITVTALGWTDDIDEYMRLADIIVSKPGGITTTECVTLGKPMIAVRPIPGQEEHNAEYLLENGYGVIAHTVDDLLYHMTTFLEGKETLPQKKAPPQNGAQTILSHITQIT